MLPVALPPSDKPEAVEAKLLYDIAPHLADVATFALHKGAKQDALYRRWWFVSNVETGCRVAHAIAKDEAMLNAMAILSRKRPEDVLAAYRKLRRAKKVAR